MEGFKCELSLNNHMAVQTTKMLRDYMSLDPRVHTLAVVIRYWARLCGIDRQAEGTLPAHAFALLLVFFLQQETRPVLPCLHEHLERRDADTYESPLKGLKWKPRNAMTAAELLIEFFEFYALGFRVADYVVSVRHPGGISKDEKQWKGKKLAIEDPYSTKRPLTRSVNSVGVLDFITDCFKIAYLYFGTVQTRNGPVITKILVPDASSKSPTPPPKVATATRLENEKRNGEEEQDKVQDLLKTLKIGSDGEIGRAAESPPAAEGAAAPAVVPAGAMTLEELERSLRPAKPISKQSSNDDEEAGGDLGVSETFDSFTRKVGRELTPKQAQRVTDLVPKNMILFQFDAGIFTAGQSPGFVCSVCGSEGHLQSNCPEERLPPARPLPHLAPAYRAEVVKVCYETMLHCQPKSSELRARERLVDDLVKFIRVRLNNPTAQLVVFGSSHNGFAFENSDLDISLTFADRTEDQVDAIAVIEALADRLKRMNGIRNIQPITSAKVPIVKFYHGPTRVEADISLYNVLAQENTAMLRFYATIDERVKVLGYLAKLFAKRCDIGDASRGSLSSYAYILMLIHYLQQCDPPVLPVLQVIANSLVAGTGTL